MFIGKMTLRSQFVVVITLPCIALLLVSWAGLNGISKLQQQTHALAENTSAPMRSLAEVASRIPRMRVGIDMMLLQEVDGLKDSRGVLTRVKEARSEDIAEMDAALRDALDAQVSDEARAAVKKIIDRFSNVKANELEPMFKALEKNDLPTAHDIYSNKYAKSYGDMRVAVNKLLDQLLEQAEQRYTNSITTYESSRNYMIVLVIVAIAASLLLATLILRRLSKRVKGLRNYVVDASENLDLRTHIELSGQDELAEIASHFNQLLSKIHKAIEAVAQNSQTLATTAGEVASKAHMTHENCLNERDRTTQMATAINEVGATIENIAENASLAADSAKKASERSSQGAKVVADARQGINTLSKEISNVSTVIGSLAEQTNSIGSILETIRGISEQTNLLALNAAIEAARAGEQGRGFAVVADEVRNLASRSAASTEEIQTMINRLQDQSAKTVSVMKESQDHSLRVVEQADEANTSLGSITEYISSISDVNIQVATATEEQATVVSELSRDVEDINHLTSETAEFADQLTDSSRQLHELSQLLNQLVQQFKL
ncbi:methyl-accepting chemotaxis protein [Gynuella sp.]|uniref:methyl-accepting chemotaxis protein n=1 Tax=Gynuella sp. TaxID=2969146 RepID=UPI003D0E5F28